MSKNISPASSWLLLSSFFIAAFLTLGVMTPLAVSAQNAEGTLNGLDDTANMIDAFKGQTGAGADYTSVFLATKAGQIIGLVLSFVGILFLGLIIYAGIMWMTAAGNDQTITKAKDLLINATIGIVIVFAAYALTAFLGNQFIQ